MDSFVEDITARRMNSVGSEVGSDSNITVNQCHVGKEVDASADAPKDKRIKKVKPQKSAVDALRKSDSTSVVELRELDRTAVDVATESDYINVDALKESNNTSVDSTGKPYNAILDSDRELDDMGVEFGGSDNKAIDTVGQLKTTTEDAPVELDNATDQVLGDSDNAKDVLQESTVMDMLDTIGVDPTTSEYDDMMDLDILEAKTYGSI